jgi:predicted RecA/RadA family phage recombinase
MTDNMGGESDDDRDQSTDVEVVSGAPVEAKRGDAVQVGDELPVVARLVIEIRSDGRRTIARGAMEDMEQGHKVAVEAKGDTPFQLAWALARSVFSMPALARSTARGLLKGRTKKK